MIYSTVLTHKQKTAISVGLYTQYHTASTEVLLVIKQAVNYGNLQFFIYENERTQKFTNYLVLVLYAIKNFYIIFCLFYSFTY